MTVDRVGSVVSAPARLMGISAQLAEARAQLRAATPSGTWDAVLHEVGRLQVEHSMPLLDALRTVYAKLAAGWVPRG
jgi:hypothetical protein